MAREELGRCYLQALRLYRREQFLGPNGAWANLRARRQKRFLLYGSRDNPSVSGWRGAPYVRWWSLDWREGNLTMRLGCVLPWIETWCVRAPKLETQRARPVRRHRPGRAQRSLVGQLSARSRRVVDRYDGQTPAVAEGSASVFRGGRGWQQRSRTPSWLTRHCVLRLTCVSGIRRGSPKTLRREPLQPCTRHRNSRESKVPDTFSSRNRRSPEIADRGEDHRHSAA